MNNTPDTTTDDRVGQDFDEEKETGSAKIFSIYETC